MPVKRADEAGALTLITSALPSVVDAVHRYPAKLGIAHLSAPTAMSVYQPS
jgi:hypothetical protein